MEKKRLMYSDIEAFKKNLYREEKSAATVEKYFRDVNTFFRFTENQLITKEVVIALKKNLIEKGYAVRSINSMLASINSLFHFLGWSECKVKNLRQQRQVYCTEEKELSKGEYLRLLKAAKKQPQLWLLMQTICGTGIRVSELKYFTVEAIKRGEVIIYCKNKTRMIFVPNKLKTMLLKFAKQQKIKSGPIFITRKGKYLDRSVIWAKMKKLCAKAEVKSTKVFPHNLRKLFARTFYKIEKDIAKLADVLGHSSIDTTRIYIMSSGNEHRKKIERLGLVMLE